MQDINRARQDAKEGAYPEWALLTYPAQLAAHKLTSVDRVAMAAPGAWLAAEPESGPRPLWYDDPRRWGTAFESDTMATSLRHCSRKLTFPESADFVSFNFVTQDSQSSWLDSTPIVLATSR